MTRALQSSRCRVREGYPECDGGAAAAVAKAAVGVAGRYFCLTKKSKKNKKINKKKHPKLSIKNTHKNPKIVKNGQKTPKFQRKYHKIPFSSKNPNI